MLIQVNTDTHIDGTEPRAALVRATLEAIAFEVRDFRYDDIDIAIRFGMGRYDGLISHRLMDNIIIPVCSPHLLKHGPPLTTPRDLLNHTLVHIEWTGQGITWPNWRTWMKAAGVEDFDPARCIVMKESTHVIQAAIEGTVVALCDFSMVANDLSAGRLVRPFPHEVRGR